MTWNKDIEKLFETLSNSGFLKATTLDEWRQGNLKELPPSYKQGNFERAGYLVWDWIRWHGPNGEIKREEILQPTYFAFLVVALENLEFKTFYWANIGLAFLSYQTNLEITKKKGE